MPGLMSHLEKLAVEIGERAVGSSGNLAAANYIESIFEESGLVVERRELACAGWLADRGKVEWRAEPGGEWMSESIFVNPFSPSCRAEADKLGFGDPRRLQKASTDGGLLGKIVLIHGPISRESIFPKGFAVYNPEEHRNLVSALEEDSPLAVLAVWPRTGGAQAIFADADFLVSSATLTFSQANRLLWRLDDGPTEVRLTIQCERKPSSTASIIARRSHRSKNVLAQGSRKVVMAHHDTKHTTPGAIDNAPGVSILLALSERLAVSDIEQDIELIAFTGEENLPSGSLAYLEADSDLAATY